MKQEVYNISQTRSKENNNMALFVELTYPQRDEITVENLKEYRDGLSKDLKEYYIGTGKMRSIDTAHHAAIIAAIDLVLKEFTPT